MGGRLRRVVDRRGTGCIARVCFRVASLAALAAASSAVLVRGAEAHEILPGVTGFPSLLLHPFVGVETALVMLGLALATGAAEQVRMLAAAVVVIVGVSAGVMLQPSIVLVPGLWRLPLLLALVLGALAASGRSVSRSALLVLVLLAASVVGMAVPPERSGLMGRVETIAAVVVAMSIVMLAIALPRRRFGHVRLVQLAGQVGGAWISAIALLGIAAQVGVAPN